MAELPESTANITVRHMQYGNKGVLFFVCTAGGFNDSVYWRPVRPIRILSVHIWNNTLWAVGAGNVSGASFVVRPPDQVFDNYLVTHGVNSSSSVTDLRYRRFPINWQFRPDTEFGVIIGMTDPNFSFSVNVYYEFVENSSDSAVSPSSAACGFIDYLRGECVHGA